jgi:polysaccharide biosynthesis transport protein
VKLIHALQASVWDLIEVCARRKRAVFATAATLLLLSVLGCCFPLRKYTASTVIQMRDPSSDLQKEATVLQSATVARKVIKDLKLEHDLEEKETFNPPFSPVYGALGLIAPRRPTPSPGLDHPSVVAVRAFRANVRVTMEPGSRLLRVDYTHRDPAVATAVVNDLLKTFFDDRRKTRIQANDQLAHWLQERLAEIGQQSEDLQARVAATRRNNALRRTAILLSQTQMNSMLKASAAQVARTGSAELIAQLSPTLMENGTPLLQGLLRQQKALQVQIDRDSSKIANGQMGNGSIEGTRERAALESLEQSLRAEVNRVKERTQHDFENASNAEQRIRATYEAQRTVAEKRNAQGVEYSALSRQADQSHELYQDLHRLLQQTVVLEIPHSSHVTVTNQVSVALPGKTVGPLYLALGAMAGVLLACCAALLVESLGDKPWKTAAEAQEMKAFHEATRIAFNHRRYENRGGVYAAHEATGRWAHTQFPNDPWNEMESSATERPLSGITLLPGRRNAPKPSVTPARTPRFGVIIGRRDAATRTETAVSPKHPDSSAAG